MFSLLIGKELSNIFILRTPQDANKIAAAGKNKNVLIIGSSFIGMEVILKLFYSLFNNCFQHIYQFQIAAYFADKAALVTVVGNSSLPFEKSLGREIGEYLKGLHETKGVKFIANTSVQKYIGDDEGQVKQVELKNGATVEADVVVLGVGVTPNTQFLKDTDIDLNDYGYVKVNSHLESSVSGIYAAGDIAQFPLKCFDNAEVSIGHWGLAMTMGRCVGRNVALGNKEEFQSVPFFWTAQYGKSVRYEMYKIYIRKVIEIYYV